MANIFKLSNGVVNKLDLNGVSSPIKSDGKAHAKKGTAVFVCSGQKRWSEGQVVDHEEDRLVVRLTNKQEIRVKASNVMISNECNLAEVSDLSQLNPVNSVTVLHCLKKRYETDIYYTKAGQTVIAMNPFKSMPCLYNNNAVVKHSGGSNKQTLEPHIFAVAQDAYTQLRLNSWHPNQSIVVSGESGAGKTVTAKHLMRYLTAVSNTSLDAIHASSRIEQRILDSNPILEAFGNAQTLRNHNSSRFGKYIQLQFQRSGQILGGYIKTYLLEKTRVVHQTAGECNFHIFYQFLNGAKDNMCSDMTYNIASVEGRDKEKDLQAWESTKAAMQDIGLHSQQQTDIFQLITAILNIGNIGFVQEEDDVCGIDPENVGVLKCLETASEILGVNPTDLEKTLNFRQIKASHSRRQSVFHKPCSLSESASRRDCLAKLLYSRLFDWLVSFINNCIISENLYGFIGLLDIYGFECFTDNSLEQLCINYANEKLQQHFVAHFLRDLQEDYEREGVPWSYTTYVDNRPCLDLLDGAPGVFALLNEECQLNRPASGSNLVQRVTTSLRSNTHLRQSKPSVHNPSFIVVHYAGQVQYNTDALLEKNKDNVPQELLDLLRLSSNQFVAQLFSDVVVDLPGKKKKTVLLKFKSSMDNLMGTLSSTHAHYIRCIKPNTKCVPDMFDEEYVMSQLEACGVTETVEIGRQAYPARITYTNFLHQYGLLMREEKNFQSNLELEREANKENEIELEMENLLDVVLRKKTSTPRTSTPKKSTPKRKLRRRAGLSSADHSRRLCASIMSLIFNSSHRTDNESGYRMGRTKIFLRDGQLEALESARMVVLSKQAFTIQCAWRRHRRYMRHQRKTNKAATVIQAVVRGWLVRRRREKKTKAAVLTIERAYLRYKERAQLKRKVLELVLQSRRWSSEEACQQNNVKGMSVVTCGAMVNNEGGDCDQILNEVKRTCHKSKCIDNETEVNAAKTCDIVIGSVRQRSRLPPPTLPKPKRCHVVRSLPTVASVLAEIQNNKTLVSYPRIPILQASHGVLSRRQVCEGKIRFHTRANNILMYAHFANYAGRNPSLVDCLSQRDIGISCSKPTTYY